MFALRARGETIPTNAIARITRAQRPVALATDRLLSDRILVIFYALGYRPEGATKQRDYDLFSQFMACTANAVTDTRCDFWIHSSSDCQADAGRLPAKLTWSHSRATNCPTGLYFDNEITEKPASCSGNVNKPSRLQESSRESAQMVSVIQKYFGHDSVSVWECE